MFFWTGINLHHSADEADRVLVERLHASLYHFIILIDGTLVKGIPLDQVGHHNNRLRHNFTSLGVCVIGKLHQREINPNQWHSLLVLLGRLCQSWRIKAENILGHKEAGGITLCPGNLNTTGIRRIVKRTVY